MSIQVKRVEDSVYKKKDLELVPEFSADDFEKLLDFVFKRKNSDAMQKLRVELYNFIEGHKNEEYGKQCLQFFDNRTEDGISTSWLSYCYFNGVSFDQDDKKAYEYAEKSSEIYGDGWGHFSMGFAMVLGRGCPRDPVKAVQYFNKSIKCNCGNHFRLQFDVK